MKKTVLIALITACFIACTNKQEEQANSLVESARQSLARGDYRTAMDSITKLRAQYPEQVEARKAALPLWNESQILEAQHEIAQADSLMLLIDNKLQNEASLTLFQRNKLKYQRDSLKARYDVNCTIVRKIKKQTNE